MKFKQYIIEMAMPRAQDIAKVYYHGTSTDKAAQGILKNGIQPPDLVNKKGQLTPVEGKTYLTSDLSYATMYAVGADMVGSKLPDSFIKNGEEYAYIFVIDGRELRDIQPDEDAVGEMVSKKLPYWLYNMAEKHLTENQMKKVLWGEYAYWAQAGKKLNKIMTSAQKLEIIDLGASIANTGSLRIKEAWKLHKNDNIKLKEDGSNFFKVAERIK
jgi:hypothetical protein